MRKPNPASYALFLTSPTKIVFFLLLFLILSTLFKTLSFCRKPGTAGHQTKVHGIMNEDLEDKPSFDEIAEEFLEFVDGSTLVIHNAAFDIGFLNNELKLASSKYPKLEDICEVEDSLAIAKDKFPGQRNSLDALANRFDISNYDRTFHGALLDANILADVYMMLTGGQSKFEFSSNSISNNNQNANSKNGISKEGLELKLIKADKNDLDQHESRLLDIEERNSIKTLWRELH